MLRVESLPPRSDVLRPEKMEVFLSRNMGIDFASLSY
jgi:hypothetical protein